MLVEVCRGLRTQTSTEAVDIVGGEDGIDRTDIHLGGVAGLHVILNDSLQTQHDILEPLHLLETLDKVLHRRLTLGQFHLTILCPEEVAMRHRVSCPHITLPLEHLVVESIEGIVCQTSVPDDDRFLQETQYLYLDHHIIHRQHPLTSRQLGELLDDTEVLDEIRITLTRDGQVTAFHLIAGVFQDIDIPTETEVLHVIRQEMQMDTTVTLHLQGVLDIKTVEADGTPSYR